MVAWFVTTRTPFGRAVYAVGGNERSAELSGVRVNRSSEELLADAKLLEEAGAFSIVLEHMFKTVQGLKFEVHNIIGEDRLWVLKWTFTGTIKPIGEVKIVGLTEVALNEEAQVIRHIDYWDSGEEVYSKVPVLGALIRLIRSRASA